MKKISVMLLAALMLFAFVSCDEKTPEPEGEKVVYAMDTAEKISAVDHSKGSISFDSDKNAAAIIKAGAFLDGEGLNNGTDIVPVAGTSYTLSYDVEILKPESPVDISFSHAFSKEGESGTFQDAFLTFKATSTSVEVIDAANGSNGEHKGPLKAVGFGTANSLTFTVKDTYSYEGGKYSQEVEISQGETSIGTMTRSSLQGTTDGIFWCVYYPSTAQEESAPYGYISNLNVVEN